MRAFVFTAPALASYAGRFVWLEIDTERPQNGAFLEKFPIELWPTFLVLDPKDERVAVRFAGALTVSELQTLLDDVPRSLRAHSGRRIQGAVGESGLAQDGHGSAEEALAHADQLAGVGGNAQAVIDYRLSLMLADADWPSHDRAVISLLTCLQAIEAHQEVVRLALGALPPSKRTPSTFAVALAGLGSALELDEDAPARADSLSTLEAQVQALLADPPPGVAADDRSSAYEALVRARKQAKDEAGARKAAEKWAGFLEREAARAETPEQRAVFDSHRLSVYIELGQTERAIPILTASERDLPDDYNPPARLAVAYLNLKQWDQALAASDRALARVYGPRRLRVLEVRSNIQAGQGDRAAARRTLEEAVASAEALPPGQRSEATTVALRKKLESLK